MASASSDLIYVDDSLPGISRKRCGKGWSYYDPRGELITDESERRRLNAIALPPAYVSAWFCPAANGHILATGFDAKGRKQYRYHPEFRTAREGQKFDGCLAFGKLLPLVRKRVDEELRGRILNENRAVASVVRLLDMGAVRIGNEAYARDNKSFGATTLRRRHAELTGKTLRLRYRGKSGQMRDLTLTDRSLTRMVRKMHDLPGQSLFKYVDDDGEVHAVGSSAVNEYLAESMGARFTAKNFRTWHGSVMAFECLLNGEGKLPLKEVLSCVAAKLGNTPAVTRKSYIHPAVLALIDSQEEWRESVRLPRATQWLSREERGLIDLLESAPSAEVLLAA